MGTTTNIERERALTWIVRQLRWEQTLAGLRGSDETYDRKAA